MVSEEDFQTTLDLDPANHALRQVFADWLEENGDERAAGYRALGAIGAYPYRSKSRGPTGGHWFFCVRNEVYVANNPDAAHGLPQGWHYDSNADSRQRRFVEDAAATAFARLPPEQQTAILAAGVPT